MQFRGKIARAMLGAVLVAGASASYSASVRAETRTLSLYEIHTKETITVTFKRDGKFDEHGLRQLNQFMRDWRTDDITEMDRELVDLIWALHSSLGSKEPIHLISGYRSAATNAKLRRRGGGQARKSQHILGKAADIHFPDVPVKTLRASAMIREVGGVGYYPTSGIPFVHVDTGRVRSWPRMPRLELAALFPDGKTAHRPSDGRAITKKDHARAAAKGMVNHTLIASASGTAAPLPKPVPAPTQVAQIAPAALNPGVPAPGVPADVIAAYTPPELPLKNAPAPTPAASNFPAPMALGPANDPEPQRFALASTGGGLPFVRAGLGPNQEKSSIPAEPVPAGIPLSAQPGIPVYENATVVTAPEVDDDHPDALSYMPFDTAHLMTETSLAHSTDITPLVHPEQHDLDYLFEDMDRPTTFSFRKGSGYRDLASAQEFSGPAVKSLYAEADKPAPTQVAQAR